MGTPATLIHHIGDEYRSVTVNFVGYPSILKTLDHYKTHQDVEDLFSYGDIRFLDEDTSKSEFYARDRGEDLEDLKYRVYPTPEDAKRFEIGHYAYLFDGGFWKII